MGKILNEYFAPVITVEKDMETRELGEINSDILKSVHITEEKVLDILKRIKVDKSLGPDQAYPRILWEVREVIARFFAEMSMGEMPEDWRLANVVLLFKKGGKENPGNHRP
eukprot:g42835.t1